MSHTGVDWHYFILGKITAESFAFYRAWEHPSVSSIIGAGAALIVVIAAVVVIAALTWFRLWRPLFTEWLTSLDHKKIGIMYIVLAFVMLARALIEASLMRFQQAAAINAPGVVSPEHFGELFSTHGTIMIFFMAMPFLAGLINYVMPLQIGTRDVAFPLLNSISLMLTIAGAGLMMASLDIGKFSTGGWSGYPPYTELAYSPDVGPDYWIWAVTLSTIGNTLTGINFAVTIYKLRTRGMTLMRMPLFCWTALCTSILMIFAMPPLTVATALLAFDRYLGGHFFTNGMGGNMMNFVNLFWLFGHPEVYIVVLPAFGIYSEVVSTFSSKELYGYVSLVLATMAIGVLSFTVWLHHFFTMGQSPHVNAVFGIATMAIGIPTGVKIYDWVWTMFRGEVRFTPPMLFSIAFMLTFVIGGMTGIMLANPPVDFEVHNTTFLVAHFHNMLIPGTLYGLLAGYMYWFPKAFGFRLHEGWGRAVVVCFVVGFYLAFMPLYVMGLGGLPRRSAEIFDPAFRPWLYVALGGAVIIGCGFASLGIQLLVSIRLRHANRVFAGDPWDGRSLEWSMSAPPPEYNFAVLPVVHDRDTFAYDKVHGLAYHRPPRYENIVMPKNSWTGVIIGACGFIAGFALVFHLWWLAPWGVLGVVGAVILRSFVRDTHKVIPAHEVAEEEAHWLRCVRAVRPVRRELEESPANEGLAKELA